MKPKTYQTKLVCINCGMRDFYTLPFGSEFMPFEGPEDSSTGVRVLSHFKDGLPEDEKPLQEYDKSCRNCGLPFLVGEYWDKKEAEELVKTPEIKDTKG